MSKITPAPKVLMFKRDMGLLQGKQGRRSEEKTGCFVKPTTYLNMDYPKMMTIRTSFSNNHMGLLTLSQRQK